MPEASFSSFPALGRSRDAGGEVDSLPSGASLPDIALEPRVGNWPCDCGHWYRVLTEPLTFWPRNSTAGYRTAPATACVVCGIGLQERFDFEAARLVPFK